MAKPILVVKVPSADQHKWDLKSFGEMLSANFDDWHVWVAPVLWDDAEPIQFECFHVGNATDIAIEELKKQITEQFIELNKHKP